MRNAWSSVSVSCVALLFAALGSREVAALHAGRERKDVLHRIAKAQVTAHPLRRDVSTCASDRTLCAASVGGGCCPSRYACGTDSCYATTSGTASACDKAGFFQCGAENSGGCCPVGYVCAPDNCLLPVSVTNTFTSCPNSYYLCPASLNFGCCMSGMGCAVNGCYSTAPYITTITQAVTTTSGTRVFTTTQTAVTVATPVPPTGAAQTDNNFAAKYIPTAVAKVGPVASSSNDSGGGGGLSTAALGGIVAGVVVLLIAVIVAAYLIIKRLNRVATAVESKKGTSSGPTKSQSQQMQMAYYGRHLHSPSDDMSFDPLIMTPNSLNTSGAPTPQIGGGIRGRSDSNLSPSQNDMLSSRHASPDSNAGYFDLPARVHNMPGSRPNISTAALRGSIDSHTTHGGSQHHWRQQSNASELSADGSEHSANVNTRLVLPELDTNGPYAELPSGGDGGTRSRSGSGATSIGSPRVSFGHARQGSLATGAAAFGSGLGVVNESTAETTSHEQHGYYGPNDRQVGQTSAGLDADWDMHSPTDPGLVQRQPPRQ
ncbi:hypothetical protein B0H63DRAFT_447485 [Podospora didyma]|uniref:Mid2 domain-containing protein n=1 Tax=Podospora didyma TaxID=330526 RepID=A0AAE0NRV7_9PEZI|nr:hypothetical protein B0H63DRAFT_447485 [Podospora didyma]